MAELINCPRCDKLFVKGFRDICPDCYKEEEKAFQTVYAYMKQRKNREATVLDIVEGTGVEEELILKFVKEKRLRTSLFPRLAYKCERCDREITEGNLCTNCSSELLGDLEQQEKIDAVTTRNKMSDKATYFTKK
ncbi:hypothetical protein KO561_15310 [Radiobacillus kanasensis]|uniref:TIGR03826 family flagellar region protein n=1 Tax=Radiobacillus kanasensis TaxID=2844358 RepID=UPI001E349608|nr:TIGR03826 family flagellar region protein [Radiobacillus kanasensis]UFT98552.1 hypothetical protein KO561_15310 [Radiobacillus kanasensis]